jgi:hypothetical protein
MTTETQQSNAIQALDLLYGQMVNAAGIAAPTPGVSFNLGQGLRPFGIKGASGKIKRVQGLLAGSNAPTNGVNGGASPSWYPFVRIPSTALVLSVEVILISGTLTTFTGDVTGAHSDAFDGTPYSLQIKGPPSGLSSAPGNALILNPAATSTGLSGSNSLFAPAFVFGGLTARVWTDVTFGSGAGVGLYGSSPIASQDQPLWQWAGFTSDFGGNVDIGALTTATNSVASPVLAMRLTYFDDNA